MEEVNSEEQGHQGEHQGESTYQTLANKVEGDKVLAIGIMDEDIIRADDSGNDIMLIEQARLVSEATGTEPIQLEGTPQNPHHRSWKRLARQSPISKQNHDFPQTNADQTEKRKATTLLEEDVILKQGRYSSYGNDSVDAVNEDSKCYPSNHLSPTAEAASQPCRSQ